MKSRSMMMPATRWMIPAVFAPPQNPIQALAGSWYAYLSPHPVNDRRRNVVNMITCWILAERSNLSISFGMVLFMAPSLSEQAVANVREDIKHHVDADEEEHAHGQDDECDLGPVGDGMHGLVRDGGDELLIGALVALLAGHDLVLPRDGRCGVLGASDIVEAVAARAGRRAGMSHFQFPAVEAFEIALHDQRSEAVLLRHDLFLMAGAAGLDYVKMIDRRFPACLGLDGMGTAVAARADRKIGRLLRDHVLSVHACLVDVVDIGMAVYAGCLGHRVLFALLRDRRRKVCNGLVRPARGEPL